MELRKIIYHEGETMPLIKCMNLINGTGYDEVLNEFNKFSNKNVAADKSEDTLVRKFLQKYYIYEIKSDKKRKFKDLQLGNGKYLIICSDIDKSNHVGCIKDGTFYLYDESTLNLDVKKIYKENTTALYKLWMDNNSIFLNSTFILDELEHLRSIMLYSLRKFSFDSDILPFRKLDIEQSLMYAQKYFDSKNIDIDIKKMVEDGDLILSSDNKQTIKLDNVTLVRNGYCVYNAKKHKKTVKIYISNTLLDIVLLIHELMHFLNQPKALRSETSSILTESLSYVNELIYCSENLDESDKDIYFSRFCNNLYNTVYNLYYLYKLIYVYKKEHNITKEAYKNLFNDDEYEITFKMFYNFIEFGGNIFLLSIHLIGFALAIYMFEEHNKDNNFFENIRELNDSINKLDLKKALSIINIDSIEDLVQKYNIASDTFLKKINGKGDIKR